MPGDGDSPAPGLAGRSSGTLEHIRREQHDRLGAFVLPPVRNAVGFAGDVAGLVDDRHRAGAAVFDRSAADGVDQRRAAAVAVNIGTMPPGSTTRRRVRSWRPSTEISLPRSIEPMTVSVTPFGAVRAFLRALAISWPEDNRRERRGRKAGSGGEHNARCNDGLIEHDEAP